MGAPSFPAPGEGEPSRGGHAPAAPLRLSPVMSSRKLQAHDFINRYFAQWGQSPTIGELAAHLDISRKNTHRMIHEMAKLRMIEVVAGKARGIRLLDRGDEVSEGEILARLRAAGWTIGVGDRVVQAPIEAAFGGVTDSGLFPLPLLDHDPGLDGDAGTGIDEEAPNDAGTA